MTANDIIAVLPYELGLILQVSPQLIRAQELVWTQPNPSVSLLHSCFSKISLAFPLSILAGLDIWKEPIESLTRKPQRFVAFLIRIQHIKASIDV